MYDNGLQRLPVLRVETQGVHEPTTAMILESIERKIDVAASEIRDIIEELEKEIGYSVNIEAVPYSGETRKRVKLSVVLVLGDKMYYSKGSR